MLTWDSPKFLKHAKNEDNVSKKTHIVCPVRHTHGLVPGNNILLI